MIYQIDNVLLSEEIFTECFCCDLEKCKGECCVEGDAGAPVTIEEVAELENVLDTIWEDLSPQAQAIIDKQGVAYTDEEGDLVTSIVNGKDCVFTYYSPLHPAESEDFGSKVMHTSVPLSSEGCGLCCLCATEKAFRAGKTNWCKPISCALYPIRVTNLSNGTFALNYNEWSVCKSAREKGRELGLPLWKFLKDPLIRRFGKEWYASLEICAKQVEEMKAEENKSR